MHLLLCLLSLSSAGVITIASLSASDYSIRSSSSLTFAIQLITQIPSGGELLIIFPPQFSASSSVYCSITGVTSSSSAQCSFAGLTLSLSNCFPSTSSTLSWTIHALTSPLYAQTTDSFQVLTVSSSGTVLDFISTGLSLQFLPLSMPSASLTAKTSVAGGFSSWVLSIRTEYEVPGLYLELPQWNGYLDPPSALIGTYCEGLECSSVYSKNYLDFNMTAYCTCENSIVTIPGSSGGGDAIIEIFMKTPPSTDVVQGGVVYSAAAGGSIETSGVSLQVETSATAIVEVEMGNSLLEESNDYVITILCPDPAPENADLVMEFSTGIGVGGISIFGIFGVVFYCDFEINQQTVTISSSFSGYLVQNSTIQIYLLNVENPALDSKHTINVKILTITGGELCSAILPLDYTTHPLSVSIAPESESINSLTSYTFSMQSVYLTQSSAVLITFPPQLSLISASCSLFSATCLFTYPQVLLTSLNFTDIFSITIAGILNANLTTPTDTFLIQAFSDSTLQGLIAENSTISISCTPGSLTAKITTGSDIVGEIADYCLQIQLQDIVPSGGGLIISFPEEMQVGADSACSKLQGLAAGAICQFKNNTVIINNSFTGVMIYNIEVVITNIKNPSSTCESSSFEITSTYNGSTIDQLNTAVGVAVTSPNALGVSLQCSSYTVGKISSYSFSVTTTNNAPELLQIKIPADISIPNPICSAISVNIKSLSCSTSANYLDIIFQFVSSSVNSYEFLVDNVENPSSLKPSGVFSLLTLKGGCAVDQGNTSVTMTSPSPLNVTFAPSSTLLGSPSNYSFLIEYSTPLPLGSVLCLNFSSNFPLLPSCYLNAACNKFLYSIECSPVSNLTIYNLTNQASPISLSLSTTTDSYLVDQYPPIQFIPDCSSTCLTCQYSSDVCTDCYSGTFLYNSTCLSACPEGYGPVLSACTQCSDLCLACEGSADYCTDCTNGLVYNGSCLAACPNTTISTNTSCEDCAESCYTCQGNINTCTSCSGNLSFYLDQCLDKCPVSYFAVAGLCQLCPCSADLLGNGICENSCNIAACNYDNNDCGSGISVKSLPTITAGAGSVAATSLGKAVGGGSMAGPTLAIWGVTQSCSWLAMAYSLHGEGQGRRLVGEKSSTIIFDLFVALLVAKLVINVVFTGLFFGRYGRGDPGYGLWMGQHRVTVGVVGTVSAVFSFQFVRVTYTGPRCFSCFRARFFRESTVNVMLIAHSVISVVFVIAPIIALLAYVLVAYYDNQDIFLQAADCMGLSILIALSTVFDLVYLSLQVGRENANGRAIVSEEHAGSSVAPELGVGSKFAEETYETKFEENRFTERALRDTDKSDIFEPEVEEGFMDNPQKIMHPGDILEDPTEIDESTLVPDEFDTNLFIARHKPTGLFLLLKQTPESRSGSKILDIKNPKKGWQIGRTVNESDIKLVSVSSISNMHVNAVHNFSGYSIVILQSFSGSYLNDLSTGTVLSRILPEEYLSQVLPDTFDLHYGSVSISNSDYRVRRTFRNSLVVDVISNEKFRSNVNFDISFDGEFGVIDNTTARLSDKLNGEVKAEIDSKELKEIQYKRLRKQKLSPIGVNPFVSGDGELNTLEEQNSTENKFSNFS